MSFHGPVPCSDTLQDGIIPSAEVAKGGHPSQKQPSKTKQNKRIIFQAVPFPEQQLHIHKDVSRTTQPGSTSSDDSLK